MLVAIPYVAFLALHHYQILGWLQLSGQFQRVRPEMLVAIPCVAFLALHHYQDLGWLQLSGQFQRVRPEMLVAIPCVAFLALHHYQDLGWLQLSGQFLVRDADRKMRLALRELETSTRLLVAVFLSFDHSAVSTQESPFFQNREQVGIECFESASDSHDNRPRLSCRSATRDSNCDIDMAEFLGCLQGIQDRQTVFLDAEKGIE